MNDIELPLVSVCIPAYNNEDYIQETAECVLNQTYPNVELVIVDDNSKDKTLEIIQNLAAKDSRVKVFHNEKNLGMSGNWNRCLELCRGKYMKLLCADDLLASDLLEQEVAVLETCEEALMVSSDTAFINNKGQTTGQYKRYGKGGLTDGKSAAKHSLFTRNYLGAPLANTFRKTVYEQLGGFDSQFSYIVDYDFFMNIAIHGKIYVIHKPLNFFRIRSDSNTGQVMNGDQGEKYVAEHKKLVEKYAQTLGIGKAGQKMSIAARRCLSALGGIYLKIFAR